MRYLILLFVAAFLVLNEPISSAADLGTTVAGDHELTAEASLGTISADLGAVDADTCQVAADQTHLNCPLTDACVAEIQYNNYRTAYQEPEGSRLVFYGAIVLASNCSSTSSKAPDWKCVPTCHSVGEAVPRATS
jgi:hypothetical protein